MVVYSRKYYRVAVLALLTPLLAALPASAEDWREKLREGPQARASGHAFGPDDGPALSYQALLRGGYTSNADSGFDPVPSAFIRTEQELLIRKPVGNARLGLHLRGSADAPFEAAEIDFADLETAVSLAGKDASGRALASTLSYRAENDTGLVHHDIGATFETRQSAGDLTHFVTASANTFFYEPLPIGGVPFDLGDNDRMRFGLESGFDMPLGERITGTLSAGVVDIRYQRAIDLAGIERASTSGFVRTAIAIGGKGPVTGEAGIMAFHRAYDEAAQDGETFFLGDATSPGASTRRPRPDCAIWATWRNP